MLIHMLIRVAFCWLRQRSTSKATQSCVSVFFYKLLMRKMPDSRFLLTRFIVRVHMFIPEFIIRVTKIKKTNSRCSNRKLKKNRKFFSCFMVQLKMCERNRYVRHIIMNFYLLFFCLCFLSRVSERVVTNRAINLRQTLILTIYRSTHLS